jgi:hypothetical protein
MKIKRGTVREDGLVFWSRKNGKEIWVTVEQFEKNKLQYKEYIQKKWYPKNREKVIAKVSEWIKQNKEKRNKYCRDWARKNYSKSYASKKAWRLNNPEKNKEAQKNHYILYPENRVKKLALRRCRQKDQAPTLNENQKKIIDCFYKQAVRLTERFGFQFEVDHITPVARGGKHEPRNLQVLPMKINRAKGYKNIFIWQDYHSPSSSLE